MNYDSRISDAQAEAWKKQLEAAATSIKISHDAVRIIVAFVRKPSEDGVDCSADREVLAQQIEREFLK